MKVFTLRKALRNQLLRLVTSQHIPLLLTARKVPERSGRDQERHKNQRISIIVDWKGTQWPGERLPGSLSYNKPQEIILLCHEISAIFLEECQ